MREKLDRFAGGVHRSPSALVPFLVSLPEFMNFKLFGKTILVENKKFGLFFCHPLSKWGEGSPTKIDYGTKGTLITNLYWRT